MAAKLSDHDLETALREVIEPNDEIIVVYSAIWSFAHRMGGAPNEVTERIFDILVSIIGSERTVLFPTFTNKFAKSRRFDLTKDDSDCSGELANFALRSSGFKRTRQPIHSYTVRGPRADEVLARACTTAWGDDSIIAWMGEVNARIVPFGLPWHYACSCYHRMEEVLQVPYRYYKRFAGTLLDHGEEIGSCTEVKYANSLVVPQRYNHTVVHPRMAEMGVINTSGNTLIPLQSAKAKDIFHASRSVLENDVYGYVQNRDEVKAWVRNGRAEEIASLAEDERWPQP